MPTANTGPPPPPAAAAFKSDAPRCRAKEPSIATRGCRKSTPQEGVSNIGDFGSGLPPGPESVHGVRSGGLPGAPRGRTTIPAGGTGAAATGGTGGRATPTGARAAGGRAGHARALQRRWLMKGSPAVRHSRPFGVAWCAHTPHRRFSVCFVWLRREVMSGGGQ